MTLKIEKLKELVIENGMSYTELAKKSNISKTHISRMINSKEVKVRPKTMKALADSLGVNYKELHEGDE